MGTKIHNTTERAVLNPLSLLLLIAGLLSGCQPVQREPYPVTTELAFPQEALDANVAGQSDMALMPGDVIEVKFFYTPELNENQMVRPDGKIALQLIDEVEVEGKTPARLRQKLLELYAPHLKSPEIAVVVRSLYNRRVFVGGEVIRPGIVEMPGQMTLLEAVMQAGGFDLTKAEVKNVIVIRHGNGQRYGYSVNLEPALEGRNVPPFYLGPEDIVYVPRTTIVKVDQWVDQHINKIIPDTGFNLSRTMGDTVVGVGSWR